MPIERSEFRDAMARLGAAVNVVTTDGEGVATLYGLPEGETSMDVYAPDHTPSVATVTVTDKVGTCRLDLPRGPLGEAVVTTTRISPEISWIGAVVLMFAAIVPSTPAKTAIAGLVAVSMNPAAMLLARFRGTWNFNPATDALLMHYPDYLLVGVAVVISHVVTSLSQQVAKAREMGSYQLGELLGEVVG